MKDSDARRILDIGREDESKPTVGGYEDQSSLPKANTGDEDAPFAKVAPFVQKPEEYWTALVLEDVTDDGNYIDGPIIDVTRWSLLTAYIDVNDIWDEGANLSLIPQSSYDVEDVTQFRPIGVINPVITPVAVDSETYGSRMMYQTELRTQSPGVSDFSISLAFDVRAANGFRFRAGALGTSEGPTTITLKYTLSM